MELLKKAAPMQRGEGQGLPSNYYFLNHTSFLRKDKQGEFMERTGVYAPHYDVRIIVDSNYAGALDKIEKVEYTLDPNYPTNSYTIADRAHKFLLKELANGESIVHAKMHLSVGGTPITLSRYLTLWETGPRLP